MVHFDSSRLLYLALAFLCGCVGNGERTAREVEPEDTCSFRSPTTCWSVGGRFPARSTSPRDHQDILADTSTVLALLADTTTATVAKSEENYKP